MCPGCAERDKRLKEIGSTIDHMAQSISMWSAKFRIESRMRACVSQRVSALERDIGHIKQKLMTIMVSVDQVGKSWCVECSSDWEGEHAHDCWVAEFIGARRRSKAA